MRRALLTVTCGAAFLLLHPPVARAMGFGSVVTATTLGQPLNFQALVALDADESLARECVAAEVVIGESKVAPENVRVTLETVRETGERRVRVTTRTIVDEPIVAVTVTVGCTSQVSRRFVAFVDPPLVNLASTPEESLPPQRLDTQVAPLLDIVRSADASRREPAAQDAVRNGLPDLEERAARRRQARADRVAAATLARRSQTVPEARVATARTPRTIAAPLRSAAASPRATPRLQLEAAPAFAAASASRANDATAGTPPNAAALAALESAAAQYRAAQAAADSASSAVGREQARIQLLEAGLARLRSDSLAQQKTLVEMQARLRQAEGERYANSLVYALSAGMLFFALLAAAFWALRPRQRARARWFEEAAKRERRARAEGGRSTPDRPSVASGGPSATPLVSQHPSQWTDAHTGSLPLTTPATIGGLEVTTVLGPQSHYERMSEAAASANASTPGEVTRPIAASPMEDLIDLEQQAEFFVVLGQDEAAIALLAAHLRDAGATSPLPYLQLLEIHQRRGDRDAYDEVRRTFQRHFKAFAPEWSSDLHFGRSLEEYPQSIARLQALWPTPLHAMHSLDGMLFRRSENDESYDFPAYRDLLFLYSIARDRAGAVETDFGPIDLFLPLEDAASDAGPDTEPFEQHAVDVDLDVTNWPGNEPTEGLVIRRSVGQRGAAG